MDQEESFAFSVQTHGARRLETFSNPVALPQRVDEHKLDTNVTAIGRLQSAEDLSEW
jgi:hypothetical protein